MRKQNKLDLCREKTLLVYLVSQNLLYLKEYEITYNNCMVLLIDYKDY
jgi:hypothetical protein